MTVAPLGVDLLGAATVTVAVNRPVPDTRDALGIVHRGDPEVEMVEGVLVDTVEGAGEQMEGTGDERRPRAVLVLHFPKTYTRALEGCTVTIEDAGESGLPECWSGEWTVIGDPMPYDPRLTPGPWNRKVRVSRVDV